MAPDPSEVASVISPLVSGVFALLGALVGSIGSAIATGFQLRSQRRQDRLRLAVEAAIEDHKIAIEIAKHNDGAQVAPLSGYIHYHARVFELLESGEVNAENLRALYLEQDRIFEALREASGEKRDSK